ncbi:MAG TPA: hypothetical protein VIC06_14575 [Solirubrobacteraceae bacterium]
MKLVDTFSASMRPLLDEYVFALRAAEDARVGFGWLGRLENIAEDDIAWEALGKIVSGLPVQWDKHTKRAMELAGVLGLTPKAQKALSVKAKEGKDGEQDDPFGGLDELEPRRQARSQG